MDGREPPVSLKNDVRGGNFHVIENKELKRNERHKSRILLKIGETVTNEMLALSLLVFDR